MVNNRVENIEYILSHIRVDLVNETRKALLLCTDFEIDRIKNSNILEVQLKYILCKMYIFNRIDKNDIPNWDVEDSVMCRLIKDKYLSEIREYKISKLLGDDH